MFQFWICIYYYLKLIPVNKRGFVETARNGQLVLEIQPENNNFTFYYRIGIPFVEFKLFDVILYYCEIHWSTNCEVSYYYCWTLKVNYKEETTIWTCVFNIFYPTSQPSEWKSYSPIQQTENQTN